MRFTAFTTSYALWLCISVSTNAGERVAEDMPGHNLPRRDEPSALSRIIGGIIASTFGMLTVFLLPLMLSWEFPFKMWFLMRINSVYTLPIFYGWILVIGSAALYIGYKLGAAETMDVLNIIWGTGESNDPRIQKLARSLRKAVLIAGLSTYVILSFIKIVVEG
ncbi:MAG: hypothetical protein AB1810_14170 [Pseudomonadota bacterium]